MKKITITLIVLLASLVGKAQMSTVLLSTGIPAFVGSSVYYAIGEPVYDVTTNTSENLNAHNKKLARYKNTRTIAMVGSSVLLLSGVILKSAEIKTSKSTSLGYGASGVQFTLKW